jgi:RNA polymerase sigma factor (sigma-70 family)
LAAVPSRTRAALPGELAPEAAATHALYERYGAQVLAYCLNRLGSREEAEDAVQSTFLNAFRGLKRGVVPEAEAAWLFTIAQNVCLSRRRSSRRRDRVESPADFELVEELTPAPTGRREELFGLQDALQRMPETQRRAILMREWQGLSYREIARELGLTQTAVEPLIFRARRSLAHGLERPPERVRPRVRRSSDLGNLLAGFKSLLLGGGAAAKVAAVAVVGATGIAATVPGVRPAHQGRAAAAPPPVHAVSVAAPPPPARPVVLPAVRRAGRPAAPVVVHVTRARPAATAVRSRPAEPQGDGADDASAAAPTPTPAVASAPDEDAAAAPIEPETPAEPAPEPTDPTRSLVGVSPTPGDVSPPPPLQPDPIELPAPLPAPTSGQAPTPVVPAPAGDSLPITPAPQVAQAPGVSVSAPATEPTSDQSGRCRRPVLGRGQILPH